MGNNISQIDFPFEFERLSDEQYRKSIMRFILQSEDIVDDILTNRLQ